MSSANQPRFAIALKYSTSLDYVEPAAGVEPATF